MSIQSSVGPHDVAVAGQPYDANGVILSGYFSQNKLMSIAITAADSQTYTITINGVACSFTAGVGTTTALIAAGLVTAVNTSSQAAFVLASGTTTPITLEAKQGDFTYSDSATGGGALTETVLVAGGSTVPGGVFMCVDERGNASAADFSVRLPRQATDVTGVSRFGVATRTVGSELSYYASQSIINVQCEGRIWVSVEEAVTAGDQPYVRYAAGAGGSQLGAFRKSADTASAAAVPNAKFLTDGLAGGLAVMQFDFE